MAQTERLYYIDNLRIVLISLVILLHLNITYGGPGSWYYREVAFGSQALPLTILSALFSMTIQAFALGCFFMVAAYFTAASLDRKGPRRFITDRQKRLGIPLLAYVAALQPLTIYIANVPYWDPPVTVADFLRGYYRDGNGLGAGPLWFVAALLLFSLCYLLIRKKDGQEPETGHKPPVPGTVAMILFALVMGIITFVIRIWLPVGWSLKYLGFQFPHFTQYIGMFTVGVLAYRGRWFSKFPARRGIGWLISAFTLILSYPVVMYIGGAASERGDELFIGGMYWQSLSYSVWEQLVCVGMAAGLVVLFRSVLNRQGTFLRAMSKSAYTVYIIHAPVLVVLGVLLKSITLVPPVKFLLAAPVVVAVCFMLASVVRKLPLVRDVV